MNLFICGCCQKSIPSLNRNVHHKIPRSLGGKDTQDNLIELCPYCHDALHAIAHKLMDKKTSRTQVIDSIALVYPTNENARKICLDLALNVRNAMIDSKEKGLGPNHIVSISTTLRMYYKPLIRDRVNELQTTQEDYIRGLILSDLAQRFNLNLNLTEEKNIMKNIKTQKSLIIQ